VSTSRSQQLREALRNELQCYCDRGLLYEHGEAGHELGCQWIEAVREVYALEREEALCKTDC